MPQLQLPIFPAGVTPITTGIAFQCRDGKVTHIHGHWPRFQHDQDNLASFRLLTSEVARATQHVAQGDGGVGVGVDPV